MRVGEQQRAQTHMSTRSGEKLSMRKGEKLSIRAKEQEQDVHGSSITDFAVL
jgi:hypothetical protein